MDQIPNELLSRVFSWVMSQVDPPFVRTLCQVCTRWRRVGIATGNLWARINVTLPLSKQQQKWTETQLDHSNRYSLDILIDLRDPEWVWNEENHTATYDVVVPIVRLLVQHGTRWRTVEMLTDNWAPIFAFLSHTSARLTAPRLEVLSLSRCNAYLAASGQNFQPGHLAKPVPLLGGGGSSLDNLSTVILVGVHIEWNTTALKNNTSGAYSTAALAYTAFLSSVGLDVAATYPEAMFYLPALKELTFGFVDVGYAVKLCSLFHIPTLHSLVLEDINPCINPGNIQNANELLDLLAGPREISPSSSFPFQLSSLMQLELRCIRAEKQTFLNFLNQHQQDLTFFNMLDDTLDCLCLTVSGKDVYVCPKLAKLHSSCIDVTPDALISVACKKDDDCLRDQGPNVGERNVTGFVSGRDRCSRVARA